MYSVIFKDGSITEVEDSEANLLLQGFTHGKEKFILNGAMRSFNSVADIKPIKKDNYPLLPEVKQEPITQERHIRQLESIKRGILKFINSTPDEKPNAKRLLTRTEQAILMARKDKNFRTSPAKIFNQ